MDRSNEIGAFMTLLDRFAKAGNAEANETAYKIHDEIITAYEAALVERDKLKEENGRLIKVLEPFWAVGLRLQGSLNAGVGWIDILLYSRSPIINRGFLYTHHFIEAYEAIVKLEAAEDGTS